MAINKRIRKSGVRYQVKVRGSDGKWITETFSRLAGAEKREAELQIRKREGSLVTNLGNQISVSEYFQHWDRETAGSGISAGWRAAQVQMFNSYVSPVIGSCRLQAVTPILVSRVLSNAATLGRGSSVQMHLYNLMHKMFEDGVELFEVLSRNPVLKKLRPRIPVKEAKYLNLHEAERLLRHLEGKRFEVAVALQLFAGLRVGEVQALTWDNVDLAEGVLHVRGTYVRREDRFKDYPKGGKWHSIKMPLELWEVLQRVQDRVTSKYVAVSPKGTFLGYAGYCKALRRYCRQAEVPVISTHGLRHSTAELYMAHGASRDDLRVLFAHSSSSVTDRYVHDRGQRLEKVANVIRLFPNRGKVGACSLNVPRVGKADG